MNVLCSFCCPHRNGAEWLHIRSVLNPALLKPVHVSRYTNTLNMVVTDFINRATWLRENTGQGIVVHNLADELYKFAFEGQLSVSSSQTHNIHTHTHANTHTHTQTHRQAHTPKFVGRPV